MLGGGGGGAQFSCTSDLHDSTQCPEHEIIFMKVSFLGNFPLTKKISVANMIVFLLKSFSVYHSPMFDAWESPKRPVEVSRDVTPHLMAYQTAVETRTISAGMRTHTGQHSRLPRMHALFLLD